MDVPLFINIRATCPPCLIGIDILDSKIQVFHEFAKLQITQLKLSVDNSLKLSDMPVLPLNAIVSCVN